MFKLITPIICLAVCILIISALWDFFYRTLLNYQSFVIDKKDKSIKTVKKILKLKNDDWSVEIKGDLLSEEFDHENNIFYISKCSACPFSYSSLAMVSYAISLEYLDKKNKTKRNSIYFIQKILSKLFVISFLISFILLCFFDTGILFSYIGTGIFFITLLLEGLVYRCETNVTSNAEKLVTEAKILNKNEMINFHKVIFVMKFYNFVRNYHYLINIIRLVVLSRDTNFEKEIIRQSMDYETEFLKDKETDENSNPLHAGFKRRRNKNVNKGISFKFLDGATEDGHEDKDDYDYDYNDSDEIKDGINSDNIKKNPENKNNGLILEYNGIIYKNTALKKHSYSSEDLI